MLYPRCFICSANVAAGSSRCCCSLCSYSGSLNGLPIIVTQFQPVNNIFVGPDAACAGACLWRGSATSPPPLCSVHCEVDGPMLPAQYKSRPYSSPAAALAGPEIFKGEMEYLSKCRCSHALITAREKHAPLTTSLPPHKSSRPVNRRVKAMQL